MSFPDQQNNELFLAEQNTIYTMKRHDFMNKNNYDLYLPFKVSECLSLFDSITDSLDEVQELLLEITGLGLNPILAFNFGAQRESSNVHFNKFNMKVILSRRKQQQLSRVEELV
jgi:hypothetical protein